jgi:UDP-N-acetylmuramoyl-tripeptide--D-alanyl-D-alanine ligase
MARITLAEAARRMNGTVLQGDPSQVFETYNFDSRISSSGELFFALKAQRDGHQFIPHAHRMGAAGAVVSESVEADDETFALIRVGDTLRALQDLGRSVLQDYKVKVIGITGSVGKTSTRAVTASLLGSRLKVLEAEKNFNNHIGVPITLLRLTEDHDAVVLEMGMNSPGEILRLTDIAPPDCTVITNIQPVHLQFFDSIDDIALAKKEILDGMPSGGTAVLNGDDPRVRKIAAGFGGQIIFFGGKPDCRIRAGGLRDQSLEGMTADLDYGGQKCTLRLPFFYRSFLLNFLAAAGVGLSFGIPVSDVRRSAENLRPLPMRGEVFHLPGGLVLVDDSYNSNPAALASSLESLSGIRAGRHVAVLGDMLELGAEEGRFHSSAGRLVHSLGWDSLITVGHLGRQLAEGAVKAGMDKDKVRSFADVETACGEIEGLLQPGDLILVKGSRGLGTDRIVNFLRKGR